jgi:hypothetical protein
MSTSRKSKQATTKTRRPYGSNWPKANPHKLDLEAFRVMWRGVMMRAVVDPVSGCWLLPGQGVKGYSQVTILTKPKTRSITGNRGIYESIWGALPTGYVVGHRCDRPSCVNPMHLYACTQRENIAAIRDRSTHQSEPVYPTIQGLVHTAQRPQFRKDIRRAIKLASDPPAGPVRKR